MTGSAHAYHSAPTSGWHRPRTPVPAGSPPSHHVCSPSSGPGVASCGLRSALVRCLSCPVRHDPVFWIAGRPDPSVSRRWPARIQLHKAVHLPISGLPATSSLAQLEPVPGAPPFQRYGGEWGPQLSFLLNMLRGPKGGPDWTKPTVHLLRPQETTGPE